MSSKKILLHLVTRIGILILLFGLVFLFWYFTNDPHKHCDGNGHRHFDSGLGFFIMELMITLAFYSGLVIEMLYLFVKKQERLAFANLGFLIFSISAALACMYLIN
ncbi:hypothetical protein [Flavobacterium branchiicola]|uniref:Uncharacterized protein n=1 Tax=Flavobacterium branchiicola TaxID=1114875 RepID=A0ABV9PEF5_9FLAO|nr:hypothetical protein [Flavobacterium branchiicola]MBS7255123.1 hypothetical protein [Flavobacterium branchiicola]